MYKSFLYFLFVFSLTNVFAHEGHKHKEKADTATVVNGDTIAINSIPVEEFLAKKTVEDSLAAKAEEQEFEINYFNSAFEHLHNKIVHFPIAFILAGFLFSLIDIKLKKYELIIKILVSLSFLFGVAAFFTGSIQIVPFQNAPKEWIADLHRLLGITTVVITFLWLVFLLLKPLKKYAVILSFIAAVLVSVVSFYGGVLAH